MSPSTGGAARVQPAGNPSKRLRNDDWEFVGFMEYESQSLRAQVVKFLTDKMVGDPENPSHRAIDELEVKSMVPNCFGIDNDVFATVKAHCVKCGSACWVSYKFVLTGSVDASSIFEEAIGGMDREIVVVLEQGCHTGGESECFKRRLRKKILQKLSTGSDKPSKVRREAIDTLGTKR